MTVIVVDNMKADDTVRSIIVDIFEPTALVKSFEAMPDGDLFVFLGLKLLLCMRALF